MEPSPKTADSETQDSFLQEIQREREDRILLRALVTEFSFNSEGVPRQRSF
jgi:hypothetical protein